MAVALPSRLRATSAAAAAPNRITIGGAGTGDGLPLDPPDAPELPPELDDEELDELELDDDPPMPPVLDVLLDPFELNPPVDDE
ncbi:hypothetical protein [uncultured Sphingomonas sp.]|uniref:hypothetical protein n=1 Tax=uncultured Sphingomonas sp. TaxID=158754 RepID=UPI0035CAC220